MDLLPLVLLGSEYLAFLFKLSKLFDDVPEEPLEEDTAEDVTDLSEVSSVSSRAADALA